MRRTALAALVVILLAIPAVGAASSGARAPISADGNNVNAVAIAATAGRFGAGTQDPGSVLMGSPSEPTWHLWNLDGSLRQQSGADPIEEPGDCPSPNLGNTERCQTDVKVIALSADGRRIAVGSTARTGGQSYLFTFLDTGSMQSSRKLGQATWNGLAMDSAAQVVAIALATAQPETTDPFDGLFAAYDFTTGNPRFTLPMDAVAEAVDVSPSGAVVVGGAGSHYRVDSLGTIYEDANIQGDAVAVDVSGHAEQWSVAGYDSGFFALYARDTSQPSVPEYQKREATDSTPIQAVAIRDGATAFATGNSAGRIRLYTFDPAMTTDPVVTLASEKPSLGSVTALEFSGDGRYLAAITGGTVRLYYTGNGVLEEMWSDARPGLVGTALAIDGRGEHVVAAVGSTVIVYDAIHQIGATLPTATQQAGSNATYTFSFRNNGNRAESILLSASPPSGVVVDLPTEPVSVLPDATRNVQATVRVPATWPPGTMDIPIRQSLNGGADGEPTANLRITVPTNHKITLSTPGADSKGASRGGPAGFDVVATNSGNVQENVTLRVDGLPSGWTSQISPATFTLEPGAATTNLLVSLLPPANAPDGSRATGTLRGAFANDLRLTATVGASFAVHVTGPVGVIVQPGVTGNISAAVRNDGNTLDSIVVRLAALPAGWLGGFINGQAEWEVSGLEPGETRSVQLSLRAPEDYASDVPVQVSIVGTSVGDATKTATARVLVTVAQPTTTTDDGGDGNGIPGPGPALLLALLGLAAVAVRRRR